MYEGASAGGVQLYVGSTRLMYKIVRMFDRNIPKRTIATGLTPRGSARRTAGPWTSSRTCTQAAQQTTYRTAGAVVRRIYTEQ